MIPELQSFAEQPLGRMLSVMGRGYLHLLRERLKHLDIDRNYYALILIGSRDGLITQQELAFQLETDKVTIVRVVDYLSEKGYVKRIRKQDDKRKRSLMLTEKARQALPEIRRSISEINILMLKGIDKSAITGFGDTIEKIKKNITEKIHTS